MGAAGHPVRDYMTRVAGSAGADKKVGAAWAGISGQEHALHGEPAEIALAKLLRHTRIMVASAAMPAARQKPSCQPAFV